MPLCRPHCRRQLCYLQNLENVVVRLALVIETLTQPDWRQHVPRTRQATDVLWMEVLVPKAQRKHRRRLEKASAVALRERRLKRPVMEQDQLRHTRQARVALT